MPPVFYAMDPQEEYVYQAWELFRCCLLRTLMSYRGAAGPAGAEPVPDLAAGPPQVSSDGLTWTFRLRRGLDYAPPMQRTEITSPDIVRALLRAGDSKTGGLGPSFYLSVIQGFTAYQKGESQTISGLETPDPFTVRITETQADGSLPYILAMPMTAPIPPLPGSPGARFGTATGHDYDQNHGDPSSGYGHFLVASGPYMFAGSANLDFSVPPAQQQPVSGFRPERDGRSGSILLVRNPSWHPPTDPLRPALPDRIQVITAADTRDLFKALAHGRLDVVDDAPPASMLRRYQQSGTLRSRIETTFGNGEAYVWLNVAQPPFDDVWVRRAFAEALDRTAILDAARTSDIGFGEVPFVVANHLSPDPTEASLLSTWDPFSGAGGRGDLEAATASMDRSRYGRKGRCAGSACADVRVVVDSPLRDSEPLVRRALSRLGIRPRFEQNEDPEPCSDPRQHVAMCVDAGWFADFPDAANFLDFFFNGNNLGMSTFDHSLVGASSAQLAQWGYATSSVPSVTAELNRCNATVGSDQATCWAQVDQQLMTQIVAAVPLFYFQPLCLTGSRITRFAWDQAYVSPAFDRIAVAPA
jgi:peptide/nickel transport system substrate-binding protein